MKRTLRSILALTLAICSMLGSLSALAETVCVMQSATVYATPGDASSAVGTLPAGTVLTRDAAKSGWSRVRQGGNTAFMRSEDLTVPKACKVTAYAQSETALYRSFTEDSDKLATISAGSTVLVAATAGEWGYAQSNGKTGFVKLSALTPDAPRADAPDSSVQTMNVTAYASKDGAKVYNAKGKALGSVPLNTAVTVKAVRDNLCLVERCGVTAVMYASDLSTEKTEVSQDSGVTTISPKTYYVSSDGAKVYSGSGKVIATLPLNFAVTVSAYNDTHARVSSGKNVGFMLRSELSETQTAQTPAVTEISPKTYYVLNNGAKVADASGRELGTLSAGTAVTVDAYTDTLARVSANGSTGFMLKTDLTDTKPAETPAVTEISPKTYYVLNNGAKVADASGRELGTLSAGTAVTVDAYTDTLARVSANGSTGFMLKTDLTDTKPAETPAVTEISPKTYYVLNNGAKVADASGREIGTLSAGTAVTVDAYTDTLARVSANGSTGFMLKTDLTDTKPAQTLQYGDKGEAVEKVQSRLLELGYFTGSVGGNYLDLTKSAVAAFQSAAKLNVTGIVDAQTLAKMFADDAPKAPRKDDSGSTNAGTTTARPATGTAVEADWWKSDIQSIYARGTTATVTDVETGIAWNEYRGGGTNHADVQPATAADTANMKKACGSWSWKRRAIFVTINGVNYAASMNCMPHGSGSIKDNNFNGHHCIHFTNSRTHGSNKVCSLHQAAIKKALNATL